MNTVVKISNPNFKVNLGSFNKNKPDVIFVEGSAYIDPIFSEGYDESLRESSRAFSKIVKNMITGNDMFENTFISVVNFSSERMKPGKKTFLSFEYHLIQNRENSVCELSKKHKLFIDNILDKFYDELSDIGFKITKTK